MVSHLVSWLYSQYGHDQGQKPIHGALKRWPVVDSQAADNRTAAAQKHYHDCDDDPHGLFAFLGWFICRTIQWGQGWYIAHLVHGYGLVIAHKLLLEID
jgi:hypothetical protein